MSVHGRPNYSTRVSPLSHLDHERARLRRRLQLAMRPVEAGGIGLECRKLTFCMFVCQHYRKGTAWFSTCKPLNRAFTDEDGGHQFECTDQGGCANRGAHKSWTFSGAEAEVYPAEMASTIAQFLCSKGCAAKSTSVRPSIEVGDDNTHHSQCWRCGYGGGGGLHRCETCMRTLHLECMRYQRPGSDADANDEGFTCHYCVTRARALGGGISWPVM